MIRGNLIYLNNMDLITYKNKSYPAFQSQGFASQFAIPYAKHFCNGIGYDIGCSKKEWAFPGAIPIDIGFNNGYDAFNLPANGSVDYFFSSHNLEHLDDWIGALKYWTFLLKIGGILFLYLPAYCSEYWRPWNNRRHIHVFTPEIIKDVLEFLGYHNIFVSGVDLNYSFMAVGEKNGISS